MGSDLSRVRFDALRDHSGVVMQQGRLLLDADWNELVDIVDRRLRAGAADLGSTGPAPGVAGVAVVPRTTPDGFALSAPAGALTIGRGRMYVDGLLAENHGTVDGDFDTLLSDPRRTLSTPYLSQPYWPTPKALPTTGTHVAYLDVWRREVTPLQEADLVESAVGVDTTTRTQTAWQVKVHVPDTPGVVCSTKDADIPGWADVIASSAGRLSTGTVAVSASDDPCALPPTGDYRGLENQTYRVEVHDGGPAGTATFKWSRDNGSVAMAVTDVVSTSRLRPASLGRDQVLGLHTNDWVEILDDHRELNQLPGELRKIVVHDEDGTIAFAPPLPADLPATTTAATSRHLRVRRWDQSGQVKSASGTNLDNLDAIGASGAITVLATATAVVLEHGITVLLEAPGGRFQVGDHWVFVARTLTATVEPLVKAPPRGVHHHFARLGVLSGVTPTSDCRVSWPPACDDSDCGDCTACVTPTSHASGVLTIQAALELVKPTGGTVCLAAGIYHLDKPATIESCTSVRMRGQGPRTVLIAASGAVEVRDSAFVTLEDFTVIEAPSAPALVLANTAEVTARRLTVLVAAAVDSDLPAFDLRGVSLMTHLLDNDVLSPVGVSAGVGTDKVTAVTAGLEVARNLLVAPHSGLRFEGVVAHLLDNAVHDNTVLRAGTTGMQLLGLLAPGASFDVHDNYVSGPGTGITVSTSGFSVQDNNVQGAPGDKDRRGDGIAVGGSALADVRGPTRITGNVIREVSGDGIAVRAPVTVLDIRQNRVEVAEAGIVMEDKGRAEVAHVTGNTIRDVGGAEPGDGTPSTGIQVVGADHALVADNTVVGVGSGRTKGNQAAGIRVLACMESRVRGNAVEKVGFPQGGASTVGIQVMGIRSSSSVEGNDARRMQTEVEKASPVPWVGLIVGEPRDEKVAKPGPFVILHGKIPFLISTKLAFALQGGDIRATVTGNTVTGGGRTPAVIVSIDGDLVLANNQCTQNIQGDRPAIELRAGSATVSANRAHGGTPSVLADVPTERLAALGNITTGGIDATGGLDPRWQPLNLDNVF